MLKQKLLQKERQKITPQQIKLISLVQLSTLDFEQRVRQEIEENPALEEENMSQPSNEEYIFSNNENLENNILNDSSSFSSEKEKKEIDSFFDNNNESYYDEEEDLENFNEKNSNKTYNFNIENNISIISKSSFQEYLKNQLRTFRLNKEDLIISDFILGNIDDNGYLRRKIESITNDIFLITGKIINKKKIEKLLIKYIHKLDPIGVGARNLQECLLIQLNNKKNHKNIFLAKNVLSNNFNHFVKKHYELIQKKLSISKKKLKEILYIIKKLNPKPGRTYSDNSKIVNYQIIPDFTISVFNEKLELTLNKRNIPDLKISSLYIKMLKTYKKNKKTLTFIKNKIDSAKWFVYAIKQRKETLILIMEAIMKYQKEYFLTGDPTKIKPMILKNISNKIGLGISTISRVANSKYVDTPYGIFPIKSFFSEKMINKEGKEISSIEIKKILKDLINKENKKIPMTDEKLSKVLKKKGYLIARRTVSKYRDQMNISVSRMRKTL